MANNLLQKIKTTLLKNLVTRKKMGIKNYYGYLPDPDKILADNQYDYSILRDLVTDAHLIAAIQQRKMQVKQMGWELNYESDEKIKADAIAIMHDLDLGKIMSQMLEALLYGYSVGEIQYKMIGGKITPVDIEEKPQEWFIFTDKNELKLRKQSGSIYLFEEGEKLEPYKFIITQHNPTYVNPYGEKILSRVYWSIIFKRAAIEYWQVLAEKFGVPFLLGRHPNTWTDSQVDELVGKMTEMIENNVAAFRDDVPIEFKEQAKYEVGALFMNLIQQHNNEVSKAVLTETLTMDIGKVGSYKAADIHKEMLGFLGITDKKLVEKGLNKMWDYYTLINYGIPQGPRIKLQKKETLVEETAERDKILTEMGVEFTEEYFKKRYNLIDSDFSLKDKTGN